MPYLSVRSRSMLAPLAALLLLAAAPAGAQTSAPRQLPSAEVMLRAFEEDAVADRTDGRDGVVAVQYAVTHPAEVPPARLDSLLAGLERLATASESRTARIRAVIQLGRMADSAGFERMVRVYRAASAHSEVRDFVFSAIRDPKLPRQRDAWIALLRGVVVQPADAEDFPGASIGAMLKLVGLDAPGQAVLRDIHRRGLARNPEVRAVLADWVRKDFKLEETLPGG